MADEVAIRVDNVSKVFRLPHEKNNSIKSAFINFYRRNRSYEKQQALKDVTFEIKKGEFFGIVGRNGSGKSTLLKMLAGIYSPSKGAIQVNGKLTPFIELGVGFNMELTGRENVFLNGALLGFSRKEMQRMYKDIVKFAELERFMDQKLKNYSSGMQVRLAFSIAIRAQSDILLLDEVLAVGDAAFQQKCFDYFEELKRDKKTVVFVSHDMAAIQRFCTGAAFINNGHLLHVGTAQEVADIYAEENIESRQRAASDGEKHTSKYVVEGTIIDQTPQNVTLEVTYKTSLKEALYVGIAVLRDGVSAAEINTARQLKLSGSGKISYRLDTSNFNGGTYNIGIGLFKLDNKELIAAGKTKPQFIIKGHDPTKGATLRLADNWKDLKGAHPKN